MALPDRICSNGKHAAIRRLPAVGSVARKPLNYLQNKDETKIAPDAFNTK
jgi:hypothetical protein